MILINLFKSTCRVAREIKGKQHMFYMLAKRDFLDRFSSTYFGIFWLFLQQFIMVLVMSFVLQKGLRVNPAEGIPFIAWVLPAQAIWMFIVEGISTSTHSVTGYAYLITKISFPSFLLPLIKICSAILTHFIFLFIVITILMSHGIWPTIYWVQSLYYLFAAACLILGLGWLFSALNVFVRDVAQFVSMVLNFGMWLTPIFWNLNALEGWPKYLSLINPASYITEGYRRSFLFHIPFWQDPWWTVYYWSVVCIMLFLGSLVFCKLKPHFADVL